MNLLKILNFQFHLRLIEKNQKDMASQASKRKKCKMNFRTRKNFLIKALRIIKNEFQLTQSTIKDGESYDSSNKL